MNFLIGGQSDPIKEKSYKVEDLVRFHGLKDSWTVLERCNTKTRASWSLITSFQDTIKNRGLNSLDELVARLQSPYSGRSPTRPISEAIKIYKDKQYAKNKYGLMGTSFDHLLDLEKIKEDFILHSDGTKSEHGFVSIVSNNNKGFYVSWLDGRNTILKGPEGQHNPMTIRFAEVTNRGEIINEKELDSATCDCCQTSITGTDNGPVVVYRNRSENEIRDIYITRNINGLWETPVPVHNDGWIINGCPVNGPKVASNLNNLAVSWVTVSNGRPIVNLSFSKSNGEDFESPIKINDLDATGRVDVVFINAKDVLVSYIEGDDNGTFLRIKKVSIDGKVSVPITISEIDGGRNTGVPQLEKFNDQIVIVWTVFENGKNQLKIANLSLENI